LELFYFGHTLLAETLHIPMAGNSNWRMSVLKTSIEKIQTCRSKAGSQAWNTLPYFRCFASLARCSNEDQASGTSNCCNLAPLRWGSLLPPVMRRLQWVVCVADWLAVQSRTNDLIDWLSSLWKSKNHFADSSLSHPAIPIEWTTRSSSIKVSLPNERTRTNEQPVLLIQVTTSKCIPRHAGNACRTWNHASVFTRSPFGRGIWYEWRALDGSVHPHRILVIRS